MSPNLAEGLPPMQLGMRVPACRVWRLPPVAAPSGYEVRAFRPGDEESWLEALHLGGFTAWDRPRFDAFMADPERRQGSRVAISEGQVVAATWASRKAAPEDDVGVLDYVVTHPLHRGRGLARAVCTGVMRFLVARGCRAVFLLTDDWRLPAIGLYLSLGFEPEMTREDMPARWEAVMRLLAAERKDRA